MATGVLWAAIYVTTAIAGVAATFHRNLCSSWNLGQRWIDLRVEHTPQLDDLHSFPERHGHHITVKPAFFVAASHVPKVAHVFAFTVFVWVLHFRGGAARLGCTRPTPVSSSLYTTPLPLPNMNDIYATMTFSFFFLDRMCLGFSLVTGEGIMADMTVAKG
ncbi:hypothetical protein MUK42_13273 [Musa troglodytarum]|uniref:Uncharacterized protein n=1 Tax=Musa troglodytarum TaxID=320322 RepID=A0A9E7G743_9LILI|nr:hypothetical protein MUK42_13273 [Musa troglodytarum]